MNEKLWNSVPEFSDALTEQEKSDDARHGDTWLRRTRKGQEWRTMLVYAGYFFRYFVFGEPVPWLKIAGGAHICWQREQHPEKWKK